jgi:hypothetical protein
MNTSDMSSDPFGTLVTPSEPLGPVLAAKFGNFIKRSQYGVAFKPRRVHDRQPMTRQLSGPITSDKALPTPVGAVQMHVSFAPCKEKGRRIRGNAFSTNHMHTPTK